MAKLDLRRDADEMEKNPIRTDRIKKKTKRRAAGWGRMKNRKQFTKEWNNLL